MLALFVGLYTCWIIAHILTQIARIGPILMFTPLMGIEHHASCGRVITLITVIGIMLVHFLFMLRNLGRVVGFKVAQFARPLPTFMLALLVLF